MMDLATLGAMAASCLASGGLAVTVVKVLDRRSARRARVSAAEATADGSVAKMAIGAFKGVIDNLGEQLESLRGQLEAEHKACDSKLDVMRHEAQAERHAAKGRETALQFKLAEIEDEAREAKEDREECNRRCTALASEMTELRRQVTHASRPPDR